MEWSRCVSAGMVSFKWQLLSYKYTFVLLLSSLLLFHVEFFRTRSSGLTCAQGRLQKGRPPRAVPNLIHMRVLLSHWWSLFLWLLLLSLNPQWKVILPRVLGESGSMSVFSTTAMILLSHSLMDGHSVSECSWYLQRISTWLANLAARPRTAWFQSPLCLLSCRLTV